MKSDRGFRLSNAVTRRGFGVRRAGRAELHRLLRVGGIFSIVIPCDPGLAYEFARQISSARIFRRRYKMPYSWLMRREHINSPAEIISTLKGGFEEIDRTFFPLNPIPAVFANLCLGMTYRRR